MDNWLDGADEECKNYDAVMGAPQCDYSVLQRIDASAPNLAQNGQATTGGLLHPYPDEKNRSTGLLKVSVDDLVPPCPDCGRRPSEYAPDAAWHRDVLELHAVNPFATKVAQCPMVPVVYCCEVCTQERDKIAREGDRDTRIRAMISSTYHGGMLPASARGCRWEKSDSSIEAKNRDAWMAARNAKSGNVWICGNPGTGKTFMARCMANAVLADGKSVGELSALELRTWREVDSEIRRWTAPYLLILDDLDKLHVSEWSLGNLFALLDRRISAKYKRLVVTANVTGATLAATWRRNAAVTMGATISSIFERMLPATAITLSGGSNRERTK